MKTQRLTVLALAINALLLLFIAARPAEETFDKIKVKEFELVGIDGKERASIKVESSGEVVFRLRDETGAIRVKIGGDVSGSGFVFLDQGTNPAIHGTTGKDGGKLTMLDKAGKKRVY